VERFDNFASKNALAGKVAADHICYKCGSSESFEHTRSLFEHESDYIHQSIISNRRIAYIRLKGGIATSLGPIYFLELSDQKPDSSQREGFDHIEVYPTAQPYEDLIAQLELFETVTKVERPHHTTHDIDIGEGFLFRCTTEPLIEKIKHSEMK
jgi:predicted metalloenzyme YecM